MHGPMPAGRAEALGEATAREDALRGQLNAAQEAALAAEAARDEARAALDASACTEAAVAALRENDARLQRCVCSLSCSSLPRLGMVLPNNAVGRTRHL